MPKRDVFSFPFSKIYPLLVSKVEKKGRSRRDVDAAITWLFGYSDGEIFQMAQSDISYRTFLTSAPNPNPKRFEKRGRVCGIKVEEIEDGMERDMRILDLLVDEISKGKKLEKVFLEE